MPKQYIIYLKLLATALLWGGTFVAGRVLAKEVAPFSAAFLRFSLATLCLLYFMNRRGRRQDPTGVNLLATSQSAHPRNLSLKDWLICLSLGLSGVFIYNAFFFLGLQTVEAGRAAVIIACNPVCIALLAWLLLGESMNAPRLAGIILSFLGAMLAVTRGNLTGLLGEHFSVGDFYLLGCLFSWVFYSLMGKIITKRLSPIASVSYSCAIGAALLLPFALHEGLISHIFQFSWRAWVCILYFGFLGTAVGFTWFYEGVKQLGASRAGIFINFVPLVAIFGGHFFLGESISYSLLAGVLLVCAGTFLVNRR